MKDLVVFYAILDWGLGHATRSVPMIEGLRARDCRVIIGGSGNSLSYIRDRFSGLESHEIPSYAVNYTHSRAWVDISMQVPKINRAIKAEEEWLRNFMCSTKVDAIVSDNCYGMVTDQVPSILITHQLDLQIPAALKVLAQKKLNGHLGRFRETWIADNPAEPRLAGALSVPPKNHASTYLGILSRFRAPEQPVAVIPHSVLALVSGPETQRTQFENDLVSQLQNVRGPATVVCGLPAENFDEPVGKVRRVSHMADDQLAEAILQAETLICRSGYSTLMDLEKLWKRAILIATPGQPEQEYLASYHKKLGHHRVCAMHDLPELLQHADVSKPLQPTREALLDEVLDTFVGDLISTH